MDQDCHNSQADRFLILKKQVSNKWIAPVNSHENISIGFQFALKVLSRNSCFLKSVVGKDSVLAACVSHTAWRTDKSSWMPKMWCIKDSPNKSGT